MQELRVQTAPMFSGFALLSVFYADADTVEYQTPWTSIPTGVYVSVGLTLDPAATLQLYIDGTLDATVPTGRLQTKAVDRVDGAR